MKIKLEKKITDERNCWFSDSNFGWGTKCPAGGIILPGKFRSGLCDEPIPRPEEFYGLYVFVCVCVCVCVCVSLSMIRCNSNPLYLQ
jgi:hypothetical protein